MSPEDYYLLSGQGDCLLAEDEAWLAELEALDVEMARWPAPSATAMVELVEWAEAA